MRAELVAYLQELAALLDEHPATELTLAWGDCRVTLKRPGRQESRSPAPAGSGPAGERTGMDPLPAGPPFIEAAPGETIRAHLVGLFHSHVPDSDTPLVAPGDRVKAGSVVGFIESMRVMNEVVSPLEGEVMEIDVEDGQPVEFGQELMRLAVVADADVPPGGET